ncbi:MAG TPA: glycosyltransferase family 2 protein [bacterium]|nr:glycosyltransferase family 2 protein [bacterium]
MITLYALVGVDPHILNFALFRKFLEHYRASGIRDFIFDLHTGRGDMAKVAEYRALAESHGAVIRHVVDEPFSVKDLQFRLLNSLVQELSGSNHWCLPVDSDEFIKFPGGDAVAFFAECDRGGYNAVIGNLLDRFSLDPPFAEIDEARSLDELFPWAYPLTRLIRKGWDRKVVAFKGRFTLINGHHGLDREFGRIAAQLEYSFLNLVDRFRSARLRRFFRRVYPYLEFPAPGIRRWPGRLEIHHMAWDSLLREKMIARLQLKGRALREYHNVLRFLDEADLGRRLRGHLLEKVSLVAG